MDATATTIIGHRYVLHEPLGQGGMGAVYRALDRLTNTYVALKRVTAPTAKLTFGTIGATPQFGSPSVALANEFRTLASLRHPNIISVLDYGFHHDQTPYFTMSLANGVNLYKACERKSIAQRVQYVLQMLQALSYLHRRGILHRDLKPTNTIVDTQQVKLLDFGVASHANMVAAAGTLAYMAPEIFHMQVATPASDLYAIGVILFELISGRHPYWQYSQKDDFVQKILQHQPDATLLNKHPKLKPIILKLLAKNPIERYTTAEEVIRPLSMAINTPPPTETIGIRESFLQAAHFVGRKSELAQLSDAVTKAGNEHEGSTWLISGESGVGKSRLIDEVQTLAMVNGFRVLRGQGVDGGSNYYIWRNIIRHIALNTHIPPNDGALLLEVAPELNQLVPEITHGITPSKNRLPVVLANLLRELKTPTLLILEDIHWALSSLEPLKIINNHLSQPLVVIATYQDGKAPRLAQALPEMQLIHLERFNTHEIKMLSQSMLGDSGGTPQVLDLLQVETEGNAFFIVEVVRELAKHAGDLNRVGQVTLPSRVFANGIKTLIKNQLEDIPSNIQYYLELAALDGRQLDTAILAQATPNLNHDKVLSQLTDKRILVVYNNQWRFTHDKIREEIINLIEKQKRPILHATLAKIIEENHSQKRQYISTLYHHWKQANEPRKAARYALRAGETAMSTSNFQQAMTYLEYAASHYTIEDNPSNYAYLYKLLGDAALGSNNYLGAHSHYHRSLDAAQQVNNPFSYVEALNGLGLTHERMSQYDLAKENFKKALDAAKQYHQHGNVATALRGLGKIYMRQLQYQKAEKTLIDSLKLTRQLNDPNGTLETLHALGNLAWLDENTINAALYHQEALELSQKIGDQYQEAESFVGLARINSTLNNFNDAKDYYTQAQTISETIGAWHIQAACWQGNGHTNYAQKNYQEAIECYQKSQNIAEKIGHKELICENNAHLALAYIQIEHIPNAIFHLKASIKIALALNLYQTLALSLISASEIYLQLRKASHGAKLLGVVSDKFDLQPLRLQHYYKHAEAQLQTALEKSAYAQYHEQGKSLILIEVLDTLLP